jgi:putative ABC transport system permease protein
LKTLFQDVLFALRQFRKAPGISTATVLTLGLGIGINAAVFTLAYLLVLERLPVPNPTELVRYTFRNGGQDIGLSGPLYDALQKHESGLTGLLAWSQSSFAVQENGVVTGTKGALMTGNGFRVLELQPAIGRAFGEADDTTAGGPNGFQALLGYDYWRNHFQSADSVLGKVLTVNGKPVTVIGVLPKDFDGLIVGEHVDILLPLSFEAVLNSKPQRENPGSFWLTVMGRMKPGESLRRALADLRATEVTVRRDADGQNVFLSGFFASFKLGVESGSAGRSFLRVAYESPLLALEILAGLLLLLCCTNVALLTLARLVGRHQEFAVRLAIGASRPRIFRLVLAEGIVLAACGLGVGILVGWWSAKSLAAMIASFGQVPPIDVTPRAAILAFTAGVTVLAALLASVLPAINAGRTALSPDLKQTQASSSLKNLGGWFVPLQVALAIVLLASASLLIGTLRNLLLQRSGFRAEGVVMAEIDLSLGKPTASMAAQQAQRILDQVVAAPGVQSATLMSTPPLHSWFSSGHYFSIDSHGIVHSDMEAWPESVSPTYFATMGTAIQQGRGFLSQDLSGPHVCVLSASAAHRFFPGEDPIGKLVFAGADNPESDGKKAVDPADTCSVVGVAEDAHFRTLRETPPRTIYQLFGADGPGMTFSLAVKSGTPADVVSSIRRTVQSVAPAAIAPTPYTFSDLQDEDLKRERLLSILSSSCAAIALLLTGLGLYALLARLVALRTREIGIRLALGSQPRSVLALVIREGMTLVVAGVAFGLLPALAVSRVLHSLLFGVTTVSLMFAGAIALLVAVGVTACYIPARRASRVDPMVALRYE